MTPSVPIATVSNPTPADSDDFGISLSLTNNTVVIGANLDDTVNYNEGAAHVYRIIDPTIVNTVVVNDGSMQRSQVLSLKVNFDSTMTLPTNPANAFLLKRQSDGALVSLDAVVDGSSVTLTFAAGPVEFGSLADGRYSLTVLAAQINGGNFDGNGDGIAGDDYVLIGSPANGLFRLFGDTNGDGYVGPNDLVALRLAFGGNGIAFDFNNNGSVDTSDFIQFRLRFGGSI